MAASAEPSARDFRKYGCSWALALLAVLIDACYWDELVTRAPVNTRAWVLQERLMAPRVLHFCRDQIAWECSTFYTAAEGHPAGVPKFEVFETTRSSQRSPRRKGLDPWEDGTTAARGSAPGLGPEAGCTPPSARTSTHSSCGRGWWRRIPGRARPRAGDKLIAPCVRRGTTHGTHQSWARTEASSRRAKPSACTASSRPVEYVAGLSLG